ncbi:acetyltransferase [Burkholderia pseudomallei]|uniref:DapH/DapD/GlmU-related protein n=1 Tax=Burkholderia pseudomallei TaxID=28450 RepID=UPI00097567C4|nr:DapH/DapD/GlmU-related protein [Burkholderia pseudomallei]OMS82786.1 acetyltransferase [Burkholderia pseudomallei]CAJ5743966.1 putative acetyltransferase [Burkholderia pseudomallei]CAJ5899211.1 putative acetyltransferase [Burkholderia pseudomallei]VBL06598.1 putative acetyltransferase [Burkholderia pseudomallei]
MLERLFFLFHRVGRVARSRMWRIAGQPAFARRGRASKIFGWRAIRVGKRATIGDACWIQAVERYGGQSFRPSISIGDDVHLSDAVHISAVSSIEIGNGCLLGSRIYIGDHAHGDSADGAHRAMSPARRPLARVEPIRIGDDCWICDGAVILAGTRLAPGCIVAANAVVRLTADAACVIAGNPATIVKRL